jgi:uncharacterized protein (TIGR02284 family)
MSSQRLLKLLAYLYRIVEASEKGYAVAAANVNNRGLKVLFKSYARQRERFKEELLQHIQALGGSPRRWGSILGMLHRGRIDIFAALAIRAEEREQIVLKEASLGEKAALWAYQHVLKHTLPTEIRALLARHYQAIKQSAERVRWLQGKGATRLLVRLFDSLADADLAVEELERAGLQPHIEARMPLAELGELYTGRGNTIRETLLSGSVGGALWGGLIGLLAGWSVEYSSYLIPFDSFSPQGIWAVITLLGCLGGALIGALLGLFVGIGISEEDAYLHQHSLDHGQILLFIQVNDSQAAFAAQLLAQINRQARATPLNLPS